MTLAALNSLNFPDFVATLGWIFEDSPWVAGLAFSERPFGDLDALHSAMCGVVRQASRQEQIALLRAHPDLGTKARISDASQGEQAGAGLDCLTPHEFDRLSRLNATYRDRFGIPFLFAVKGSTKHEILRALEHRIESSPEAEFREALRQVERIARFRLEAALM